MQFSGGAYLPLFPSCTLFAASRWADGKPMETGLRVSRGRPTRAMIDRNRAVVSRDRSQIQGSAPASPHGRPDSRARSKIPRFSRGVWISVGEKATQQGKQKDAKPSENRTTLLCASQPDRALRGAIRRAVFGACASGRRVPCRTAAARPARGLGLRLKKSHYRWRNPKPLESREP
jgi:hypothetical protein